MGVAVGVAVLLLLLAWLFWPSAAPSARRDNPELEAAERDVQEAADEESVRDWGPGAGRQPLP
jgi:Flp pilus assembly protein TadB